MKKTYILALLMLVAAIVIFVSASGDITTYGNFELAMESDTQLKINGELDHEFEIKYDPATNPNLFSFHMLDTKGISKEVIMTSALPQDFERSEQVVVTGAFKDDVFVATEILTKCPSKYKDQEIYLRSDS